MSVGNAGLWQVDRKPLAAEMAAQESQGDNVPAIKSIIHKLYREEPKSTVTDVEMSQVKK